MNYLNKTKILNKNKSKQLLWPSNFCLAWLPGYWPTRHPLLHHRHHHHHLCLKRFIKQWHSFKLCGYNQFAVLRSPAPVYPWPCPRHNCHGGANYGAKYWRVWCIYHLLHLLYLLYLLYLVLVDTISSRSNSHNSDRTKTVSPPQTLDQILEYNLPRGVQYSPEAR